MSKILSGQVGFGVTHPYYYMYHNFAKKLYALCPFRVFLNMHKVGNVGISANFCVHIFFQFPALLEQYDISISEIRCKQV